MEELCTQHQPPQNKPLGENSTITAVSRIQKKKKIHCLLDKTKNFGQMSGTSAKTTNPWANSQGPG